MMSIDDAILYCKGRAKADCSECAVEHLQLAEWLEELKVYKDLEEKDKLAQKKGWILCNEQMPDTEESVLLSLRNLDICVGFNANTERRFYVVGDGYVEYENVLAWQPLPEPYKS